MSTHVRIYADVAVLTTAISRVDHTTADAFQQALMPPVRRMLDAGRSIVIDMGSVEYMSSVGLRVLMLAAKEAKNRSTRIAVSGLQPAMREIFEISKFHLVLPTFEHAADALTALSGAAGAAFEQDPAHRQAPRRQGPLLIRFWGTRGSLPVSLDADAVRERLRKALRLASGLTFSDDAQIDAFIENKLGFEDRRTYGGNTSCVQIETDGPEYLLCDMGTGLRRFGRYVTDKHGGASPQVYHFLMSHLHWDHIMGFPFFTPAYVPGNRIHIYGCHSRLEEAFRRQHADPCFPVDFDQLGADIRFIRLEPQRVTRIGGLEVTAIRQPHHGDSYGYRLERGGKSVVYSTDAEHKLESLPQEEAFVEFFRAADLVIFDAMYSLADMITVREDWGHSSNVIGVDLCHRARVKHLCLFHHEPACDDAAIERIRQETLRYEELTREGPPLRVSSAYDGLEIAL